MTAATVGTLRLADSGHTIELRRHDYGIDAVLGASCDCGAWHEAAWPVADADEARRIVWKLDDALCCLLMECRADGWERVHRRHVEPGDRVRLHGRSPVWTVLSVERGVWHRTRQRRRRLGIRLVGVGDDGQRWDTTADGSSAVDVAPGSPSLTVEHWQPTT